MKTLHIIHAKRGNALLAVLGTTMILAAFSAAALHMTGGQNRMAARQRNIAKQLAAADGALEYYYAKWKSDLAANNYSWLNAAQLKGIPAPSASLHSGMAGDGVTFSKASIELADPWGSAINSSNPNGYTSESDIPTGGFPEFNLKNYPGWVGYTHYYRASARASMAKTPGFSQSIETEVRRNFQITTVPLFQCLSFFEEDLELHPGPNMSITGKVHTNQDAWIFGKSKLQFHDEVSYAGSYTEGISPELAKLENGVTGNAPYWSDGQQSASSAAKTDQLTAVERVEPFGADSATLFDTTDANPNNDSFRELIEPADPAFTDPQAIAEKRLYNKAGVVIAVDSTKAVGTAGRVKVTGSGLSTAEASKFADAVGSTVNLYDRREQASVPTTSINVAKLNDATTSVKDFNGVVYVYDSASGVNAVRLQNGAEIGMDTTIVSNDPIYIQGDFNTGGGFDSGKGKTHDPSKIPSNKDGNPTGTESPIEKNYDKKSVAVIGDAVMILSNNWNDANAAKDIANRTATHTTVNAAIMTGYIPTNYEDNGAPGGGAHNLPRFLENWGSKDFTYTGAMVQLYVSEQFDGLYNTGQIYSPPNRRWNFDTDFLTNPPAGAVNASVYSRGRWESENFVQ